MGNTSDVLGTGLKKIQSGFLDNVTRSIGTGEELNYYNVTLSTAVVAANCFVFFQGGWGTAADNGMRTTSNSAVSVMTTAKITGSTNLRLSNPVAGMLYLQGRWYVVEFY